KSTLLRTLAGLQRPLDGRVELDGVCVATMPARPRARRIAALLQEEAQVFWGNVLEYVLLGRYPHRHGVLGWSAQDVRLARAAIECMDLEAQLNQPLSTLSGGERQRARLALALTQEADVLLLDEPLQHLDLRHQLETLAWMRDLAIRDGRALCMVLHDPVQARRFCDHALLLFGDGRSAAGPSAGLLQRATLERLYGCELDDAQGARSWPEPT